MTKVLFTGATGLLGRYFLLKTPSRFQVIGTYHKNLDFKHNNFLKLDIVNKKEVVSLFERINPDIVVHAASLGNVDYCETHEDDAYEVNVKGTENILTACKRVGAKIIFTSSNAVYDGNNAPYSETSNRKPLDVYGKTKMKSEDLILDSNIPFNVVRLMTMYGWPSFGGRSNPASWIIDELKNKKRVNVVTDIFNNHLYAGQASDVIWELIKKEKKNEIYNVSGAECVSRYDLALKVAEVFELDKSYINPVNSDFFENIAKRPKNTCFDTTKIKKDFSFKPLDIVSGLKLMKNERT